jgi:hypothetical protein
MAGFSDDNVMMQQYYGSFPTTSKETAVSRKVGIRKVNITPVSNASGPSGERPEYMGNETIAERSESIAVPAAMNDLDDKDKKYAEQKPERFVSRPMGMGPRATSSKTLMYVAAYALVAGVAFLAYKKFKG